MEDIKALLGKLAENLKRGVGLAPSDVQRLRLWEDKASSSRTNDEDRLAALKEDIARVEHRLRRKKDEFDKANGLTKRIVAREIEQCARELQPYERAAMIILANVDASASLLAKIRELRLLMDRSIGEDQLDDVAVKLEEVIREAEQADRALADLQKVQYRVADPGEPDVEQSLKQVTGPKAEGAYFSKETQELLNQLEAEGG